LSILPRQSPRSLILASIKREGDLLFCDPRFFIPASLPQSRGLDKWGSPAPCRFSLELRLAKSSLMRPTPKAGDAVLWGGVLDEGVGPPKIGRSRPPSAVS